MEEILRGIGQAIDEFLSSPTVQSGFRIVLIYIGVIWLAAAFWAFKDLRSRTANPVLPYLAAALIIVFTPFLFPFGVVLYRLVRPTETVAEASERALAEEAMLVEVERQHHCGSCHRVIESDWIICPTCRTRLRRVCPSCGRLVEMDWSLCAFCGKDFERPELLRERVRAPLARPVRVPSLPASSPVAAPVEAFAVGSEPPRDAATERPHAAPLPPSVPSAERVTRPQAIPRPPAARRTAERTTSTPRAAPSGAEPLAADLPPAQRAATRGT